MSLHYKNVLILRGTNSREKGKKAHANRFLQRKMDVAKNLLANICSRKRPQEKPICIDLDVEELCALTDELHSLSRVHTSIS